jgi:hypothetical protein
MAAMTLLPTVSDLGPEAVPMIYGDAVVMGLTRTRVSPPR